MGDPHFANRPRHWLQRLWISRRLVGAAFLVGILLWFILINSQTVRVHFPFGLGNPEAPIGLIVLLSAGAGSLVTALILTLVRALGRYRPAARPTDSTSALPDDRPPPDYAARTPEGFSDARWSAR
jgi:uncharacterized integral membrane protein